MNTLLCIMSCVKGGACKALDLTNVGKRASINVTDNNRHSMFFIPLYDLWSLYHELIICIVKLELLH